MRRQFLTSTTALVLLLGVGNAYAGMDEAKAFLDKEIGGVSTLSRADQEKQMQWFIDAAKPFAGMDIKVVSETLTTHQYESQVLAPAFTAITGIKVTHDVIQEGDVVEKIQTQMQTGQNIYDGWVNDSDLIGTHWRYQQVRNLTDWMAGEGKDVTDPMLDVDDFIGTKFTTAPDKKLYQLPDQQFANLYWFRYDWFNDEKNKADFKAKYGYDLGVPVNWSAYEDIAEFFTGRDVNGKKVYGHMDYGKKDPSLGWRFTDAWLSMAGNGDKGLPNGVPVDEWGIKVDAKSRPVGSCTARGGDTNGPASVYAIQKYLDWLKAYAPPEAQGMTFSESGPVPSQGNVAQQIFWYTAFTADMVKPGLPVMNEDGTPKWRMAPSPHGSYWKDGMKLGYQDVGSWTLMKSTPTDRAKAAWLYAQFVTSKTVDVKKSQVGLTFIRDSTIHDKSFTERAPKLGGLIEFYRSPARVQWTPTGTNVPDYPKLAQLWWQNIGDASSGAKTPQEAMDSLCADQEKVMARIEKSGVQGDIGPKMAEEHDLAYWNADAVKGGNLAPQLKLEQEKDKPITINYDELVKSWQK
ncbi:MULTISPECIES: ABC transporter substrate-binding protein [Mesorhizobium]|uniref:ABC transporter substrate-binding protein n=4 Tax=Mesorhizobium TaxID=68287 RepID=A0A1A5IKT7_RHILI|nr:MULTISPECIES: ABC transporter substrate-binding protein [Mesorhizobium]MBE1711568.1 carbohydrate ABC transporter substrate-binding protein [Mesorhizobium japonicum]MBE1716386.1 carbohydrate ABC transporter substrate-binding protein [Mesorhizobium japonicum]MUT24050.1 carbohydrate ABC transporter substrate-binding protein [Mesorhizobium japonicum]MUT30841.1 carbohydrate ABC transporter substrate-binding protein [Mesorhizobium japonicum]OBP71832.1 ABC transporter substrate-binding protein [Me